MADWTRQDRDRDYERNRYDESNRSQGNYGQRTGEHNRDWENRERDYSGEQWNPEHWRNRMEGRDWEQQNRNRDWENRSREWNQPSGGYRGYDTRSRNEYETGDFGTRNYGGGQTTVYGSRDYGDYGSERNRYGNQGYERNYGSDPRREYGSYWGGSEYDRGQQSRVAGTTYGGGINYGNTYGGSTYGSQNYGTSTYGGSQHEGRGRFVGRGPKNFNRTDDRIREDIIERLTLHPDIDATDIDVQVKNSEVTLMGTVDDRDQRRLAEDVCENIWGVRDVHNQVKVNKPSLWDRMTGQASETTTSGEKTKKDKAA